MDLAEDLRDRRHNYLLSLALVEADGVARAYPAAGEVEATLLGAEGVTGAACGRARQLFGQARTCLAHANLRFEDVAWSAVVRGIPLLLRVPEPVRRVFEEGT